MKERLKHLLKKWPILYSFIEEMIRVTCRALILLEWHCFNTKANPLGVYFKNILKIFINNRNKKVVV